MNKEDKIIIKGARQHNLKNITVEIPRDKLVVITGLSGSGKSSLAFDTIYAEGQRKYVESLSAYARQFLGQMDKPEVDYIEGLSPAISIDQKTTSRNPRSTVGTVTEIYDYLRLIYARIGIPHCPHCGKVIEKQSVEQIVDQVLTMEEGSKFMVLAPLIRGRKGEHKNVLDEVQRGGFARVKVDGQVYNLDEEIKLDKNKKHFISVVVDRLVVRSNITSRLSDSVETALKLAEGLVEIEIIGGAITMYSEHFACTECGISVPEIEPRLFSFNAPYGACPACTGLGVNLEFDLSLVIPDVEKSLDNGAIAAVSSNLNSYYLIMLRAVLESRGYDLSRPWKELPEDIQDLVLYGAGTEKFMFTYTNIMGETKMHNSEYDGLMNILRRRYRESMSEAQRIGYEEFMTAIPCSVCHGARLKPEVLAITVGGKNIQQVTELSVVEAIEFFSNIELTAREQIIAKQVLKEILARLNFLNNVGLDYLTLDRSAGTLSGGEAQRIRLATQIGSGLVGVLYILDEPSIGLHQRDNDKLLETLKNLRDLGNTLIVVEHDEDTMYAADEIIDMGPGAGEHGGYVVAQGDVEAIKQVPESVTGQYLLGTKQIPIPTSRRKGNGSKITVKGAKENNLKNVNVDFPLGVMTVVTGVSGSGKSTLVNDILYQAVANKLLPKKRKVGAHKEILGLENIDKVVDIDQSPIGRTPRSNPATYTGVFDYIRELFASSNEAKIRGYKPGRFSFNVKGGRCEACKGDGVNKIEMNFLPDVYVPCDVCKGKRYNRETLEVHYKGKSIAEVLEMTVSEACEFFKNQQRIYKKLQILEEVGLGYIRLGQAATTLSGGEAQRVKLATELARRSTGKTLYILDEPTTGLHIADVHKLLEVVHKLVDAGDTVIVIEHNLDVIKTADYIVDLGPEGGYKGGQVIAKGTPEKIARSSKSYTGQYLQRIFAKQ